MIKLLIFFLIPISLFGQQYLTYNHNGLNRDYIYYAPNGLSLESPLVFVAHGYSSSAQNIMNYSGFNALANQYGFAVCYPQGTTDNWGNNFWNVGYLFTSSSTVDDVGFLTSLAQELQNNYNLSPLNTFMTGMSNGGELSYLIACESPGTFKAYAPVAGTIFPDGLSNNICNGSPTPMFKIHAINDNVSYYSGDPSDQFWGPYLSVDSIINFWTNINGLSDLIVDTLPNLNNNNKFIISYKYSSVNTDNEVWLYKHMDGHSWGVDDINVQQEIWNFFSKYISSSTSLESSNITTKRKLIKVVNILGQSSEFINNKLLFYIYNDGHVKKKMINK